VLRRRVAFAHDEYIETVRRVAVAPSGKRRRLRRWRAAGDGRILLERVEVDARRPRKARGVERERRNGDVRTRTTNAAPVSGTKWPSIVKPPAPTLVPWNSPRTQRGMSSVSSKTVPDARPRAAPAPDRSREWRRGRRRRVHAAVRAFARGR
jgi:hypothetical protein